MNGEGCAGWCSMKGAVGWLLMLLSLVMAGGCSTSPQETPASAPARVLVLAYEDFGPSAMAHELIGFPWFQWQSAGGSDPGRRYDIRVVVYDAAMPLKVVQQRYPVDPQRGQDYRYVTHTAALAYLDARLAELAAMPPPEQKMFAGLKRRLEATRARIRERFSEAQPVR